MTGLLTLSIWIGLFAPAQVQVRVTPLDLKGTAFTDFFDAEKPRPRLVGVFSPTCGHCLEACAGLQSILEKFPGADLRVMILWAPYGKLDNLNEIGRAAVAYIPDSRVKHYWDVWKFGSRHYSPVLRIPEGDAWGLFVFYRPGIVWEEDEARPTFWLQNRNLRVGTSYSRRMLERKLKEWLTESK